MGEIKYTVLEGYKTDLKIEQKSLDRLRAQVVDWKLSEGKFLSLQRAIKDTKKNIKVLTKKIEGYLSVQ